MRTILSLHKLCKETVKESMHEDYSVKVQVVQGDWKSLWLRTILPWRRLCKGIVKESINEDYSVVVQVVQSDCERAYEWGLFCHGAGCAWRLWNSLWLRHILCPICHSTDVECDDWANLLCNVKSNYRWRNNVHHDLKKLQSNMCIDPLAPLGDMAVISFQTHIKDRYLEHFLRDCLRWMPPDLTVD